MMLGAALCLAACGDDDLDAERDDGGSGMQRDAAPPGMTDAAPPETTDAAPPETTDAAVQHDAGPTRPLPTNVSFETAKRLEPDGTPPLQDEVSATQVDYYVFAGSAGQFVELSTDRMTFSPDVVISLYDADHTLLAQNDEGAIWPGAPVDARLVARLPADGDYYVTVDDPYTPPEFFQASFSLLYYHLRLHPIADGIDGFAIADGSEPHAAAFAHDDKTGYDFLTLVGELGDEPNVFDLDGLAAHALIGHVQLSGTMGNGSSAAGGEVQISDADGHVLAHIDRGQDQAAIDPPVEAASYQVTVSAGGELGDAPYYVLDFVMLDDNLREQDEAGNSELAGAEPVDLQGTISRRGLVLVELPEADVDYFKLDAMASEQIAVSCEGESGGSGVRGLTAELRDDSEQVLGSATETATANLQMPPVTVSRTGTYYVRLTSETPKADTGSVAPWTRCAVRTGF
jgi:hypothetical protein